MITENTTPSELRVETRDLLSFIDSLWQDLTSNARNGRDETIYDWREAAGKSIDGWVSCTCMGGNKDCCWCGGTGLRRT